LSWGTRRGRSSRRDDDDNDWDDHDDFFRFDFDSSIAEIDEMIRRMFETAKSFSGKTDNPNSLYYGYSVTVGPDGRPKVREFGNVKRAGRGKVEIGSREPFVDMVVDEAQNELRIVAEMPGVQKQDINLEAMEDSLKISAGAEGRKYETMVPISIPVDSVTAKATYNNGILEVRMKLKSPPKTKGVGIKVE